MSDATNPDPVSDPAPSPRGESRFRAVVRRFFSLRRPTPPWQTVVFGLLSLALVYALWSFVTHGEREERIVSPVKLASPSETFQKFHSLWYDRELTRNTLTSLRRVSLGFALAAVIGVPLGVLCGCFSWLNAFFAPISLFGRNIPIAALIPLTFLMFGIGETQKVMFIFIACVAFVLTDTARAVTEVGSQYIDTAYTLGANRRQVILKVLVPLALPSVFNSLRLLFGLAFGYIMLAEVIKLGGESGGLGDIINTSQRLGPREHILLVLMIIPVVALVIDRLLYWVQCELFPYRYGGSGMLNELVRGALHLWEDAKGLIFRPKDIRLLAAAPALQTPALAAPVAGASAAPSPAAAPSTAAAVESGSSIPTAPPDAHGTSGKTPPPAGHKP